MPPSSQCWPAVQPSGSATGAPRAGVAQLRQADGLGSGADDELHACIAGRAEGSITMTVSFAPGEIRRHTRPRVPFASALRPVPSAGVN
jgi:hypothetical protein